MKPLTITYGIGSSGYSILQEDLGISKIQRSAFLSFSKSISWSFKKTDHPKHVGICTVPQDDMVWICIVTEGPRDEFGRGRALHITGELHLKKETNLQTIIEKIATEHNQVLKQKDVAVALISKNPTQLNELKLLNITGMHDAPYPQSSTAQTPPKKTTPEAPLPDPTNTQQLNPHSMRNNLLSLLLGFAIGGVALFIFIIQPTKETLASTEVELNKTQTVLNTSQTELDREKEKNKTLSESSTMLGSKVTRLENLLSDDQISKVELTRLKSESEAININTDATLSEIKELLKPLHDELKKIQKLDSDLSENKSNLNRYSENSSN